jgi:hypothetical protein
VTRPITVAGAELEVRHLASDRDVLLFVFNHGARRAQGAVTIRVPDGTYTAIDLVSNQPVPLRREAGGLTMDVALDASGVQIVNLQGARR